MIKAKLEQVLQDSLQEYPDVEIKLSIPDQEAHGDYAANVALQLGKILHKNPMDVAKEIVAVLPKLDYIAKIEVAPPGFINFFIDPQWIANETLKRILTDSTALGTSDIGKGKKVIVEHTSVNPNKAMHIGNLRNAILGDSVSKLLKKCGYTVEVQNYIDDTGVQVADTTTAIHYLHKQQPEGQPFDEFCWDIYTEINQLYETHPELAEKRKEVSRKIEEGDNDIAALAKEVADKVLQCHLEQMAKFTIFYDLLIYESDILKSGFWEQAFELLKKSPNFIYQTEGDHAGCWVLKYDGDGGDKIFVRNDGTKVYTAKDTAYHLWKFGKLGKDFLYEPWAQKIQDKTVWKTSQSGHHKEGFGHGDEVVNVIDERQTYPQDMVKLALQNLGFAEQADNYFHLAYGVVFLSPKTAQALGIDTSDNKKFYAMAGRKGIGVKVSDLLNLLIEKIESEKKEIDIVGAIPRLPAGEAGGRPELPETHNIATSLDIAIGAIRHYMLKYQHNTAIIFDYEQALTLHGNTGVYLQYSHARACGILRKAGEFDQQFSKHDAITSSEIALIKKLSRWGEVIEQAGKRLSISDIAEYAFEISSQFHSFYEENPILQAEQQTKNFRLTLTLAYQSVIADVLSVLGIFAPERM